MVPPASDARVGTPNTPDTPGTPGAPAASHNTGSWRNSGRQPLRETDSKDSEERRRKNKNTEWILTDYDAIAKALHSGHLVFYSVELSACALPAQMKAERLSFGDFVDSFESRLGDGGREQASIRFWQTKFVQGDEGQCVTLHCIIIINHYNTYMAP